MLRHVVKRSALQTSRLCNPARTFATSASRRAEVELTVGMYRRKLRQTEC